MKSSMHIYRKAIVRVAITDKNPHGVEIPVGLSSAVSKTSDISFKLLHSTCNQPVQEQNYCNGCGEDVGEDVLHGYEVTKGMFVTFTPDEMKVVRPKVGSPFVDLTKFVPRDQITPIMVSTITYLVPTQLREDDYAALYQALVVSERAGIGSQSLYGKEHPCAVLVQGGVLVLLTLNLTEQIKEPDFDPSIPEQKVARMMTEIVERQTGELLPSDLTSQEKEHTLAMIRMKETKGVLPVEVTTSEARKAVDLESALTAALAALPEKKKTPQRKARTAK